MTDQLSLYNGALLKLGQPRLSALTDEGKGRRALDFQYASRVKACLEAGYWNFATRAVKASETPSEGTTFGWQYVFDKPDDWLRTVKITVDEVGRIPLLSYEDRADYWLANQATIYVWFVSIDEDYGLDLGRWPQAFIDYVETDLALACCEEITGTAERRDRLEKMQERAWKRASNRDVLNEPVTKFPPPGRLVASRGTSRTRSRWDGTTI